MCWALALHRLCKPRRVRFSSRGGMRRSVTKGGPPLPSRAQGMPLLGRWEQGVTWSSRFNSLSSYVAADGSTTRVPELVRSDLLLRLGVLCEAATEGSRALREGTFPTRAKNDMGFAVATADAKLSKAEAL